jgi:MoaD family protein
VTVEVEVRVYGRLAEMLNTRIVNVRVDGETTLGRVLEELNRLNAEFTKTIIGENRVVKAGYIILVNGVSVENVDQYKVKPGDRVDVLPPAVGGYDPLSASLGGSTPPPSGLSDLRSEAHCSSPFRIPHSRGITFQGRGASAPVGSSDLLPTPGG